MPASPSLANVLNLPFAEQIAFFRAKLNLPTERWDDIWQAAHDRAFIVAGAMKADLLADLRGAVDKAVSQGTTLKTFRADFRQIVARHGWAGWTGEGTAAGEAWRTRVIYETNLRTSYAAGRHAQLRDPATRKALPYWRYVHSGLARDPRPEHLAWSDSGLTLPADHPFWDTHYPPNGWGCRCRVVAVREPDAGATTEPPAGWDSINPATGTPRGIDKGWGYAPGANAGTPLADLVAQKLINLDAPIGAAMWEALSPAIAQEREQAWWNTLDDWLRTGMQGAPRTQVLGALSPGVVSWLGERGVAPATAEIAVQDRLLLGPKAQRHAAAQDALSAAEWRALPALLDAPELVLMQANGKLLYVVSLPGDAAMKISVELDYALRKGARMNMIVSAYRQRSSDIEGAIRGGLLKEVR